MGIEAKGCFDVKALEHFCEQAVDDMVRSEMKDVVRRGLGQGRTKKSGERFYY